VRPIGKTVMARYRTRKGGSGMRPVYSAAEAEKILKGGYSITTAYLECGIYLVGMREKRDGKWWWFYDKDYFKEAVC
jgi:hypothetical protein